MNILGRVTVLPHLPSRLERLSDLAYNLYWTWKPAARSLFRRLDRGLWERSGHNPVVVLRDIAQERLDRAARDKAYVARYAEVIADFDSYMAQKARSGRKGDCYAYFCMEYGWHESIALYSGGLGVLAGDHTKAASDLGVPLVAVGLWYPEGYFHQRVAFDGHQEAVYERHSPLDLPFTLVQDAAGNEVRVSVTLPGREVSLRAWQVRVGRVSVYLLDSEVLENDPADRALLARLYGGDQRTRVAQEIILGIGGVRLLRALGIAPTCWHMNEGHSAFMTLERCRELVAQGMSFDQAREFVAASTIFTVHTPVTAGNDTFPFDLIGEFFSGYWDGLGLSQQQFFDLARHDLGWGPSFSMPALALRFSSGRNGVAKLHGETSRNIWSGLWPEVPEDEVPIGTITNGVHGPTWVAPEISELLETVLPSDWRDHPSDAAMWQPVHEVPNARLWEVRQALKTESVNFLRRRVLRQRVRQGASPTAMGSTEELFDPQVLTIGFARRFATYKRATLIFRDLERLQRILDSAERPVQLVFAGKAHPADASGQELITTIHTLSQDPRFAGRILFIEDYDMSVGRALARGVDVWLNNPRRPLEASGTSGQKAAMNGVLNLSILDGWWPEGYNGKNGWAIGDGLRQGAVGGSLEAMTNADADDADALYDLLEREVVPLYYQRDASGVPQAWLERAKEAIATISPAFNARRMVSEYVERYYLPASERGAAMQADDYTAATQLAKWRSRILAEWPNIYFSARALPDELHRIGETLTVEAVLHPRNISLQELRVELVYSLEADGLEINLHTIPMDCVKGYPDGGCLYRAYFQPEISGRLVYGVRVYPVHEHLSSPFDMGCIRWA